MSYLEWRPGNRKIKFNCCHLTIGSKETQKLKIPPENPYRYKALNFVNSLSKTGFGNYTISKWLITKKLYVISHTKIYNTELTEIQTLGM